ncbi:MAG: DNA-protecting protein DprA [Bacteroidales bacterium]|nr:DNA-protecting protein DprA [Bacteroidales bacterium]
MEQDLIFACALAITFESASGTARKLLDSYDSIRSLFEDKGESPASRIKKQKLEQLHSPQTMREAQGAVEWSLRNGIKPIYIYDDAYPARLRECCDAPLLLFVKGDMDLNPARALAVVGTRAATQWGCRYCENIISELGKSRPSPAIISGLAYGIDSYAHESALKHGLRTIAVMGTGFETIYPPRNANLAARILEQGAIITEQVPFAPYYPKNFALRNRIIAGMSDATLVVESKEKGGSLITANVAFGYSREVFALPGKIDDRTFAGCNNLIEKQVARIVTSAQSITSAMNWDTSTIRQQKIDFGDTGNISETGKLILNLLMEKPEIDIEDISIELKIRASDLAQPLLELELDGKISQISGNKYVING